MTVTDDPTPSVSAAPAASGEQPGDAAVAPKPGRLLTIIIVGLIVAFLAIVLFVVRNNVAADDLKVGDCFDVPNGTTIQTVEKHPCSERHDAEVIFVGEHTGTTYPISLTLDSFVEESCVPAFETYVGHAIESDGELSIGYFYPSRDGWDSGDRTITCYITQTDETPMTQSVKGA
jgi:Septum formation